jgi:flagellar biosynthesis protein FliR
VEPGLPVVALLVALRLVPVALAAPVLGGPLAPWSVRLVLTAMAALALAAVQPPEVVAAAAGLPAGALAALAVKELAVGALIALIVAIPFGAADTAGRWIGAALAAPGAEAPGLDAPAETGRRLGVLTTLLAVLIFFAIDGHLRVIEALAAGYQAVPLLAGPGGAAAGGPALAAIAGFLGAAVALAAPALVAAALVELVLGLAGRAGARIRAAAALRGAALVAFVAAGLSFLALAIARGLGEALLAIRLA